MERRLIHLIRWAPSMQLYLLYLDSQHLPRSQELFQGQNSSVTFWITLGAVPRLETIVRRLFESLLQAAPKVALLPTQDAN